MTRDEADKLQTGDPLVTHKGAEPVVLIDAQVPNYDGVGVRLPEWGWTIVPCESVRRPTPEELLTLEWPK